MKISSGISITDVRSWLSDIHWLPGIAAGLQGHKGTTGGTHLNNAGSYLSCDFKVIPAENLEGDPCCGATLYDEVVGTMQGDEFFCLAGSDGTQMDGSVLTRAMMVRNGQDKTVLFVIGTGVPQADVGSTVVECQRHGGDGYADVEGAALCAATENQCACGIKESRITGTGTVPMVQCCEEIGGSCEEGVSIVVFCNNLKNISFRLCIRHDDSMSFSVWKAFT